MSKEIYMINSRSIGNVRTEPINGRDHLVVEMMPIRGDTSMRGVMYDDAVLTSSFTQLNNAIGIAGHPALAEMPATRPSTAQKYGFGAFLLNAKKTDKRVFADLAIDVSIAESSSKGKEIMARMSSGDVIEVSTGVYIDSVAMNGTDDFGEPYQRKATSMRFDHVAILDAGVAAAGKHAGTAMLNEAAYTNEGISKDEPMTETEKAKMAELEAQVVALNSGVDEKIKLAKAEGRAEAEQEAKIKLNEAEAALNAEGLKEFKAAEPEFKEFQKAKADAHAKAVTGVVALNCGLTEATAKIMPVVELEAMLNAAKTTGKLGSAPKPKSHATPHVTLD